MDSREMGTKVKNPCHQSGRSAYFKCSHCGKYYTNLGFIRHVMKSHPEEYKKANPNI